MDKMEVILIFTLILLSAVYIAKFLYQNGFSGVRKNTEIKEKQIKVACVGDSITYGFGIENWPENNYPAILQNLLGDNYHVENFGVNGCNVGRKTDSPYFTTKTYLNSLEYKADILILMLGSNDSKPNNWTSKEKFKEEYLNLLETYVKEETKKIYLCTVSKAFFPKGRTKGLTYYGIQPEKIDIIAETIKEIAAEKGYELIDINELTSNHSSWFKKDKVHPNNEGASAIAHKVCEHIKKSE